MHVATVIGSVWATKKDPTLEGVRLLVVRPYTTDGEPSAETMIAGEAFTPGGGLPTPGQAWPAPPAGPEPHQAPPTTIGPLQQTHAPLAGPAAASAAQTSGSDGGPPQFTTGRVGLSGHGPDRVSRRAIEIGAVLASMAAVAALVFFLAGRDGGNPTGTGEETVAAIAAAGGEAIAVAGDMTSRADVDNLVAKTQAAYGASIDILVNVVGGLVQRKKLSEMDDEFFDRLMRLNVTSTFLTTHAVAPHMPDGAAIVNFSSQAGRDGGGVVPGVRWSP